MESKKTTNLPEKTSDNKNLPKKRSIKRRRRNKLDRKANTFSQF